MRIIWQPPEVLSALLTISAVALLVSAVLVFCLTLALGRRRKD